MPITSRVQVHDDFGRISELVDRETIRSLDQAAEAGLQVATSRAHTANGKQVSTFQLIPAHGTADGFASGIRANNPLWRIYDKGTLGKRRGALKGRNRRKDTWAVRPGKADREGYEASRGDISGKGIPPADISNPARTAGRKTLIAALRR